jgi:hypothetical protein
MKLARILVAIAIGVAAAAASVQGESLFDKVKKKAKDKSAETAEKTIDKAATSGTQPAKAETTAAAPTAPAGEAAAAAAPADNLKPGQGAWANYDFKPGETVLYADDFMKDEVGDFPRRLEFVSGTMEIVEWEKARWLRLTTTSKFIVPLAAALPERYTMEFDYACPAGEMWIYPGGEEKGGEDMVYMLPVFGLRAGRFTSHYSRTYIEAAQKLPAAPRLTPQQWEAIDLLAEVADALCYRMRLEPGDIQLLNNHVIYHARDAFTDDAVSGWVRRLFRLWLAMPNSRALPEDHAVLWGDVRAGALRGGIAVAVD